MELGAAPLERLADQIELTDRHARGCDEDVGGRQAPAHPLGDRLELIGSDSEIDGLAPCLDHLCHQRVGVGVRDLGRSRLGAEVRDLVPGREDRDTWATMHAHLRVSERRQEPDFGGADHAARFHDDVAGADVLTGVADVRARDDPAADRHSLTVGGDVLLRDDGVGAFGKRRPGEDPHRLPGSQRAGRHRAGDDLADDRKLDGLAGRVLSAHGVAVHRRVRPRRNRRARDDRLREHTPERRHDLDPLNP